MPTTSLTRQIYDIECSIEKVKVQIRDFWQTLSITSDSPVVYNFIELSIRNLEAARDAARFARHAATEGPKK
jgi:hypothetical protein